MLQEKSEDIIENPEELRRILKTGRYTTLALTDGNDPYVLTMNYGLDPEDDILYFHTSRTGSKLDFLKSNPYICGTVILEGALLPGSCSRSYRSVVFYGLMDVIHRENEKIHAMNCLIEQQAAEPEALKERYASQPDYFSDRLVMKLTIDEISGKKNPAA